MTRPRYAACPCGALVRHPQDWPAWYAAVLCLRCGRWLRRTSVQALEASALSARDFLYQRARAFLLADRS